MQQFYSLIILSELLKGKEITLPNGCYLIHSPMEPDKNNTGHKTSIRLDIQLTNISLIHIEITLSDNSYTVYYKTNKDILITEEINYNIPFYHDEKALFSIKKIEDHWNDTIRTNRHNTVVNKRIFFFFHQKKRLLLMVSILITLVVFWLHDKNRSENNYKNDTKTIINQFVRHNGYIQDNYHLLFIMKSGDNISNDVHDKLKPYIINTLTEKSLKHRENDIIKIIKNNKSIDIIYISNENDRSINNIDIIPDIFRNRLTIRQFSFGDITDLIKKTMGNDIVSYTIIRKHNNIIVSSEQKNGSAIAEHIKKINKIIFQNDIDTLIYYKQKEKYVDNPGIYGEKSYRILPGDHIDFTPHNK